MKKVFLTIAILALFTTQIFADSFFESLFGSSDNGPSVRAEKTIERTFIPKSDNSTLVVDNVNGNIFIEKSDDDNVYIVAEMISKRGTSEFKKVEVIIEIDDRILVKTRQLERNPKVSVNYNIKIPSTVKVKEVDSVNGGIKITGVSGNLHADTVNGGIKLIGINGTVTADTVNGGITVEDCESIGDLDTTNGSITVYVKTINRDVDLDTTNGSITVHLSTKVDAEIDFSAVNGSVKVQTDDVKIHSISKRHIYATVGNGGKKIEANTTNGSIYLKTN